MSETKSQGLNVSVKTFLAAIAVIAVLMVLTYIMTLMIPGGMYARTLDAAGNQIIDTAGGYTTVEGGLPFWKWLLSPILVLDAEGSGLIIAVIAFLLVIGGIFNALEAGGLMRYLLGRIVARFADRRHILLKVIPFFFMAMGAMIGSFEECVPLVPIVVALAVRLGWDDMTGLTMSLLAVGCGFASGVMNPFTIGVAQSLAGLPMFSGIWLRLVSFLLIYLLLMCFLHRHVRSIEKDALATERDVFRPDLRMDKAIFWFALLLGIGIVLVLSSGFIRFLQDYTMIIVAVMFLAAGLTAAFVSGMTSGTLARHFGKGVVNILPAVLLILMASSIKYTLSEGKILDTLLHWAVHAAESLPNWAVILFIYLIVLVMNFFISSGSAKAFLLIPLIVPMAQLFHIQPQLSVLAFAFGDGFSNVFYPTNAALLISLGLVNVSYGRWFRFSWKFQAANLLLTGLILLFGLAVGYC